MDNAALRRGDRRGSEVLRPAFLRLLRPKRKREKNKKEKENEEQKDEGEEHDEIALDEEQDENKSLAQELLDDPLGTIARHSGIVNFSEWEERAVEQADAPAALSRTYRDVRRQRSIVEEDETVKRSYEESLREAYAALRAGSA